MIETLLVGVARRLGELAQDVRATSDIELASLTLQVMIERLGLGVVLEDERRPRPQTPCSRAPSRYLGSRRLLGSGSVSPLIAIFDEISEV
jgi:hypothetical protein